MWHEFSDFLGRCDRPPQIWWRDDDATVGDEAWETYRQAMGETPLLAAIIADSYEASLVQAVRADKNIWVAQHGYRHANHAKDGQKKSEYPEHRDPAEVLAEFTDGMARLRQDFGEQFLPLFVPPWNRMDERFLPALSQAGFVGVSLFGSTAQSMGKLLRSDSHIDLIDWRGGKKFIGAEAVLQALCSAITRDIRPIGIMTHHKIHSSDCTSFLLDLTAFLQDNRQRVETLPPPAVARR